VVEPQKWGDFLQDGFIHSCTMTNDIKDITPSIYYVAAWEKKLPSSIFLHLSMTV
jgi:hypothetical protein